MTIGPYKFCCCDTILKLELFPPQPRCATLLLRPNSLRELDMKLSSQPRLSYFSWTPLTSKQPWTKSNSHHSLIIAEHGQIGQCWELMQDVEIVGYLTQCDRPKVVNSAKSSASGRCMRVVFRAHMYRSVQVTHLFHCGGVVHHFCDVIAASTISLATKPTGPARDSLGLQICRCRHLWPN
jgi:hypothetical protein